MEFTNQEIDLIHNDYLYKHGIFSGISTRTRRSVNTKVLSTYWTKCPFREDPARHEKFEVESETPTFIKFRNIPQRFRKETIKKGDGYATLNIAYRDNTLNKQRFHYNGNNSLENLPTWAEVKHYTDVMVRWDDADHTIDEDFDEVWFLPNKIMYVGVRTEMRVFEEHSFYQGRVYTNTKILCSPVKTEQTPMAVPVNTTMEWKDKYKMRRDRYDGNPIDEKDTNLTPRDRHSIDGGDQRILLLDGEEIILPDHQYRQEEMLRQQQVRDRFLEQCETAYLPFKTRASRSYQPRRHTTSVSYGNLFCVGVDRFTEMKHSNTPMKHEKLEGLHKKKDAFAEELVRTCLHPDRMVRMYGEGFGDIIENL